jgi:hypothetical protein
MPGNLPGNFAISGRTYIAINKDENRKSSFMKVEALREGYAIKNQNTHFFIYAQIETESLYSH